MKSKKDGDRQRRARQKAVKAKRQARAERLDARMRDEFRVLRIFRVK